MKTGRVHKCPCWHWCREDVLKAREIRQAPTPDFWRRNPKARYDMGVWQ